METAMQIFTHTDFGNIRAVLIDGEPYAAGIDVARALGYAEPGRAIRDHCGDGGVTYPLTDNLGRIRETRVIPEDDIYELIWDAAKQSKNPSIQEAATRFKDWVKKDVLPSIRKTGSYENPKHPAVKKKRAKPVDTVFRQQKNIAKIVSEEWAVPLEIAMSVAVKETERITGESLEEWKRMLPDRPKDAPIPHHTPTTLAEVLRLPNARAVNEKLTEAGLQERQGKEWRLTDLGRRYAEEHPYTRNGHNGYQIKWQDAVKDFIDSICVEEVNR